MKPMEKPALLHTPQLTLHAMSEGDEAAMAALLTNEEIARTYMIPVFDSPAAVKALFERIRQLTLAPDKVVYGIYRGQTLVGFANEVHREGETMELGYVIHPEHKNRGYATEALKALISAVFSLGFSTVVAGAFEENAASLRVMEKCAMTPTGETEEIAYRGKTHRCIFCKISKE